MLCFLLVVANGQTPKATTFGDSCETITYKLDAVGSHYTSRRTKDGYLIILASVPVKSGTKSAEAVIQDALRYLEKFHKIDMQKAIFGLRKVPSNNSDLQFFVDGALVITMNTNNMRRLCFGAGETIRP